MVKKPPVKRGDMSSIPGLGISPREGNGNHSNILAWILPMDRGELQSMGSQKSWMQLSKKATAATLTS